MAVDGTLYAEYKSLSGLSAKVYTELHKVVKWVQSNSLSLNVSTSFFTVFFSLSKALLPDLANTVIIMVHTPATIFLEILFDSKLNIAPHIGDVCTKVSGVLEPASNLRQYSHSSICANCFLISFTHFGLMALKCGINHQ